MNDKYNDTSKNVVGWPSGQAFERFPPDPWRRSLDDICRENWKIPREALEGVQCFPISSKIKSKSYLEIRKHIENEYESRHYLNRHAYMAYLLFGSAKKLQNFIDKYTSQSSTYAPISQMLTAIVYPPKKSWGNIDFREWGDALIQHGSRALDPFRRLSEEIDPVRRPNGKISLLLTEFHHAAGYRKLKAEPEPAIQQIVNMGVRFQKNIGELKRALRYYGKIVPDALPPVHASLPDWEIEGERFGMQGCVFKKLDPADPRILFLGDFTNCCERVTDAKNSLERTVAHSIHNKLHGYYVIQREEDGEILGHSWAYRGHYGAFVLDGFESHEDLFNSDNLNNLLFELRNDVLELPDLDPYQIDGIFVGPCAKHMNMPDFYYATPTAMVAPQAVSAIGMTKDCFMTVLPPTNPSWNPATYIYHPNPL